MVLIILILIFFFLGWILPRILPRLLAWMIRRKVNSFSRQMQADAEARFGGHGSSGDEKPRRAAPRKKIGADVGEYVRFEEISVETEVSVSEDEKTGSRRVDSSIKVEEQVVDVEWEDLP